MQWAIEFELRLGDLEQVMQKDGQSIQKDKLFRLKGLKLESVRKERRKSMTRTKLTLKKFKKIQSNVKM